MKNVRSLPGYFFWLKLYIAGEDYIVLLLQLFVDFHTKKKAER